MNLIDFFDYAYIINLPDRKDRHKAIIQELERVGISLLSNKIEVFSAIKPSQSKGFPNAAVRGCFLSHLTVIKEAKRRQLANVLVIEDDLKLSKIFEDAQEEIVQKLQQNSWGFVYLGHREELPRSFQVTLQPIYKPIVTAQFYGVNSIIFERLISFLEELQQRLPGDPKGGPMHLDGAYSTFRRQNPDVLTLIACPTLGSQRSSRSDISPKWFDRIFLLRQLAALARNRG